MKKHLTILFCIITMAMVLYSCASVNSISRKISIESEEIPPDMKNEEFVLIGILTGKRKFDKYIEREFALYSGKYILASKAETTEEYSDISKYRYIIDFEKETSRSGTFNSNSISGFETTTTTGFRYFIIDRKEDETYRRKSKSSFYAKELRAYLQAIERIRLK